MATNPLTDLLQQVRRIELLREGENTTDGQLLERWVRRQDSVALETLVLRHGPLVWGVCRRALPNHHDAEDAFQAAFLVFIRKAASIRSPELLASWLYGVAHQTARKARQAAAKRQARETQVTQVPEPKASSQDQEFGPDLQALLDEELGRLPDKYRIAILLCDLQGKSRAEVARQLRLPEGTVGSRLARGRAMLAKRLARRGLTVSGATLAAALSRQAVSASVPTAVLSNTIKVASLLAAGEGAGAVTAQVSALAKGVLLTMSLPKWKTAALVLLITGLVLAGGLATHHILARPQDPSAVVSPPDPPPKEPHPPEWRPDPALLKRLKTEFSFTEVGPNEVQRFHYTLKLPDGFPDHPAGRRVFPEGYVYEEVFSLPGGARLFVYVKPASLEERAGRPFERSWNELLKQPLLARNAGGLEHGDIEEGIVNGSTFYRARVTSHNKGRRGYAYVSYDGERAIYLVFTVQSQAGFEEAEKLAEAVVLTWEKH